MVRLAVTAWLLFCSACSATISAGKPDADETPDAAIPDAPPQPPPGNMVFAHDRLHRIQIEVATPYLNQLENNVDSRIPCSFTFDGHRIDNVGIRKKGGYGSPANITEKTGFSVKFDQFVSGQKLNGLKRVLLNNAKEDITFLSETIGYLSYRELGLAAPLSSHAQVTFNGEDKGIFILKEAISGEFLERVFGKSNDQGNLYEGFLHLTNQPLGDFVTHPEELDLKDEVEDKRSRTDVVALGQTILSASDTNFETQVAAKFALDMYIKSAALDTILGYWDSYGYYLNNYYLYHSPVTDTFVYIPHGMDQLMYSNPGQPMGRLLKRIFAIPALRAKFDRETAAIRNAWPAAALTARIDEVATILATATRGPQTDIDLQNFRNNRSRIRSTIANLGQP